MPSDGTALWPALGDPRTVGTTYAISTGSGRIDEQHAGAFVERSAGLAHGLGYWAVLPAVLIAVTWLLFRRRDLSSPLPHRPSAPIHG